MITRDTITRILAEAEFCDIDAEKITDEATFADLGMDSLDVAELSFSIEEEFNILVDDAEWGALESVGDLIRYVEEKTKEG